MQHHLQNLLLYQSLFPEVLFLMAIFHERVLQRRFQMCFLVLGYILPHSNISVIDVLSSSPWAIANKPTSSIEHILKSNLFLISLQFTSISWNYFSVFLLSKYQNPDLMSYHLILVSAIDLYLKYILLNIGHSEMLYYYYIINTNFTSINRSPLFC